MSEAKRGREMEAEIETEREERQNWMRGAISGDVVKRYGSARN
jgi:hypothetical protein